MTSDLPQIISTISSFTVHWVFCKHPGDKLLSTMAFNHKPRPAAGTRKRNKERGKWELGSHFMDAHLPWIPWRLWLDFFEDEREWLAVSGVVASAPMTRSRLLVGVVVTATDGWVAAEAEPLSGNRSKARAMISMQWVFNGLQLPQAKC